jgi:hypothetical protein
MEIIVPRRYTFPSKLPSNKPTDGQFAPRNSFHLYSIGVLRDYWPPPLEQKKIIKPLLKQLSGRSLENKHCPGEGSTTDANAPAKPKNKEKRNEKKGDGKGSKGKIICEHGSRRDAWLLIGRTLRCRNTNISMDEHNEIDDLKHGQ